MQRSKTKCLFIWIFRYYKNITIHNVLPYFFIMYCVHNILNYSTVLKFKCWLMQFFTAATYRWQAKSFARRTTRYDVIAFLKTTREALLFLWPRYCTFKMDGKILIWGAPATSLVVNISLLYAYAVIRKNAQRNWNWKNIKPCCYYFYHWWHFNWARGLPPSPPWLRLWRGKFIKASSWETQFVYCL